MLILYSSKFTIRYIALEAQTLYVLFLLKPYQRLTLHDYEINTSIWFSSRYNYISYNLLLGGVYKPRFYLSSSKTLVIYLYNILKFLGYITNMYQL
jgi:hypothetical protein